MAKDLRYSRTEKNIRKAFIELLKTMPYEKIKINDIIELAEISRNAFYLHYYGKDELLDRIIQSFADKLIASSERILENVEARDFVTLRECTDAMIFPFFEEQELCILLFKIYKGEIFSHKLADRLSDYIYEGADKSTLTVKEQMDFKFYCEYRANGIIGLVKYNFQHGLQYNKEEMGELLHRVNTGELVQDITPLIRK